MAKFKRRTKFKIPVLFMVSAEVEIAAEDFNEACDISQSGQLPHVETWTYFDGSFEVDHGPGEFKVLNEMGEWETKKILDE